MFLKRQEDRRRDRRRDRRDRRRDRSVGTAREKHRPRKRQKRQEKRQEGLAQRGRNTVPGGETGQERGKGCQTLGSGQEAEKCQNFVESVAANWKALAQEQRASCVARGVVLAWAWLQGAWSAFEMLPSVSGAAPLGPNIARCVGCNRRLAPSVCAAKQVLWLRRRCSGALSGVGVASPSCGYCSGGDSSSRQSVAQCGNLTAPTRVGGLPKEGKR